jgi:Cupin
VAPKERTNVIRYGGGGVPTTIISGFLSFEALSLKPITQLLPNLILIKADQALTFALQATLQLLAGEMSEQAPGSEVVANRLAEVLFIQAIRLTLRQAPTVANVDGSAQFSICRLGLHLHRFTTV